MSCVQRGSGAEYVPLRLTLPYTGSCVAGPRRRTRTLVPAAVDRRKSTNLFWPRVTVTVTAVTIYGYKPRATAEVAEFRPFSRTTVVRDGPADGRPYSPVNGPWVCGKLSTGPGRQNGNIGGASHRKSSLAPVCSLASRVGEQREFSTSIPYSSYTSVPFDFFRFRRPPSALSSCVANVKAIRLEIPDR